MTAADTKNDLLDQINENQTQFITQILNDFDMATTDGLNVTSLNASLVHGISITSNLSIQVLYVLCCTLYSYFSSSYEF